VRAEHHGVESLAQIQADDVGRHRRRAANLRKHLGRVVNAGDLKAEAQQRMRDAAGAAAEFEDRRAGGEDGRDQLGLAPTR
jgi:hypothetical protein